MCSDKKAQIKEFAKTIGIDSIGICNAGFDAELFKILNVREEFSGKCEFMQHDLYARSSPHLLLNGAKSIIVCLFPYFNNSFSFTNLSRYASLSDYHIVSKSKLNIIGNFINEKIEPCSFVCVSDTGAPVDRYLAYKAGLGFFGKNNCLINDNFGSYFFIGYIVSTCELDYDIPLNRTCICCNECIKKCPGGAIFEGYNFDPKRCVSYITQLDKITEKQADILKSQKSIYGCDICQEVCPHNKNLEDTCMTEFLEHKLDGLDYNELITLSGRQYKKKYKNFAFSWRTRKSLLKNFTGGKYAKQ